MSNNRSPFFSLLICVLPQQKSIIKGLFLSCGSDKIKIIYTDFVICLCFLLYIFYNNYQKLYLCIVFRRGMI